MDLSLLTTTTLLVFLLMLVRITGMIVAAPFFTQIGVPVQLQVAVAVTLSILLFPIYSTGASVTIDNLWMFTWIAGQEFVIGLLIGFAANLVFAAIHLAGHHISTQMGLAMAQVMDPVSQQNSPVMGQFYFILAILLFMSLNIHHSLIIAVAKSFEVVPVASTIADIGLVTARFMKMGGHLFVLSIMLVMPVLGIMLVLEVAMAFMAKIMPQMNIFMVGLPIKVAAGLLLVYLTLPFTMEKMGNAYVTLSKHLMVLFNP